MIFLQPCTQLFLYTSLTMLFSLFFLKWFYFSLLVILFGSAFLLIEISLKSFSPIFIAFSRVSIAAIILYFYALYNAFSFNFVKKNFILLFILGMSGTSLPFFLISWAQITINSSQTGVLIGFMPIFTIIGSHFYFRYESLNIYKSIGFFLGFIGLAILFFDNDQGTNVFDDLTAKIAVILGAFFYALNALLVKKISNINPIPLSASVMIISSVQLLVGLLLFGDGKYYSETISLSSVISLSIMAIFSTAIATVLYYKIIHDYGPNFLSLVNYPIPIFAFFIGVIFLSEDISIYSIISLSLVISGVYLSQKKTS